MIKLKLIYKETILTSIYKRKYIMTSIYSTNKKHIYNYRLKYPEKHNEKNRLDAKKHRRWKKIQFEFLNILLDAD